MKHLALLASERQSGHGGGRSQEGTLAPEEPTHAPLTLQPTPPQLTPSAGLFSPVLLIHRSKPQFSAWIAPDSIAQAFYNYSQIHSQYLFSWGTCFPNLIPIHSNFLFSPILNPHFLFYSPSKLCFRLLSQGHSLFRTQTVLAPFPREGMEILSKILQSI